MYCDLYKSPTVSFVGLNSQNWNGFRNYAIKSHAF